MGKKICKHYVYHNDRFLFICSSGDIVDIDNGILKKELYRGKTYYRIEKTNIRIAQSTIKRKYKPCNVLL